MEKWISWISFKGISAVFQPPDLTGRELSVRFVSRNAWRNLFSVQYYNMASDGAVMASVAAGIQVAQGLLQHVRSSEYHETEVELTRKQHAEDLRMAKKIHEDDIRVSHRLHHMELGKMMLQQKKVRSNFRV